MKTKRSNILKITLGSLIMGFIIFLGFKISMAEETVQTADLSTWPEASQKAAKMMMDKYGQPNETTPSMMVWYNNGPWKRTIVYRQEVQHNFPMPHTDVLEQVIDYKVPTEKYDELAKYDGSVVCKRTEGEISARCDKEGPNFLAINLANDIITEKEGVEGARRHYEKAIREMMLENKKDPYLETLKFTVSRGATADPDKEMMDKDDIEKIMKKGTR